MRWNSWFNHVAERRMDAEFRFHRESQISEHEPGLEPRQAELRARREFGAVAFGEDECRDQRPAGMVGSLSAGRSLRISLARKTRLAAVAMSSGSIGANTAIFGVVHAVLIRPLPYSEPGNIQCRWWYRTV
jgi:hypothetical protein